MTIPRGPMRRPLPLLGRRASLCKGPQFRGCPNVQGQTCAPFRCHARTTKTIRCRCNGSRPTSCRAERRPIVGRRFGNVATCLSCSCVCEVAHQTCLAMRRTCVVPRSLRSSTQIVLAVSLTMATTVDVAPWFHMSWSPTRMLPAGWAGTRPDILQLNGCHGLCVCV